MKYVALTMSRGDAPRMKDWLSHHASIGFNEFYILLDNPIDDSADIITNFSKSHGVNAILEILPPNGEYFDGVSSEDKWESVKKWVSDNSEEIKKCGLPIIDPLSWRQYQYFPKILSRYANSGEAGWLSLLDVDEYIVINGDGTIKDLLDSVRTPRIRLLNFNIDMQEWGGMSSVRDYKARWSRADIIDYGKGWENRVKSIVRFNSLCPLVSVHGISKGQFSVIDHELARLHHYKFPVQNISIPYSVLDNSF